MKEGVHIWLTHEEVVDSLIRKYFSRKCRRKARFKRKLARALKQFEMMI